MPKSPADQFSDDEMAQVKRFEEALGGKPTTFDEEVEQHYQRHAANIAKAAKGPVAPNAQDQQGQDQMQSSEALQNTADMGNPPVIPSSAPAKGPKTVGPPSDQPDFSTL